MKMSKSTYPLKLPKSVKEAAAELAKMDGVSLNQFIAAAVAEKVGTLRTASEFLRQRAGTAKPTGPSIDLGVHFTPLRDTAAANLARCRRQRGGRRETSVEY